MVSIPSELFPVVWREVPDTDRRTIIEGVVEELQMDMGQRMTAADAECLCRKISQTMREKYSNWRVVDFNRALELGKVGQYGAERKLTVANVEKWLFLTNPTVMSEVIAEQLRKEVAQNARKLGVVGDNLHLDGLDEDAVDLVALLFDVLLDGPQFDANIRRKIGRMLVPYVKVAVKDRRMFLFKEHPARRLLNTVAEACEGNHGEAPQEQALVASGTVLRSDVLLVPHHGSRTSSSATLLDAVQPRLALVQAGYRNAFGHPAPLVVARYAERGVRVIGSPACGAMHWHSVAPEVLQCERAVAARYWHHRLP